MFSAFDVAIVAITFFALGAAAHAVAQMVARGIRKRPALRLVDPVAEESERVIRTWEESNERVRKAVGR